MIGIFFYKKYCIWTYIQIYYSIIFVTCILWRTSILLSSLFFKNIICLMNILNIHQYSRWKNENYSNNHFHENKQKISSWLTKEISIDLFVSNHQRGFKSISFVNLSEQRIWRLLLQKIWKNYYIWYHEVWVFFDWSINHKIYIFILIMNFENLIS